MRTHEVFRRVAVLCVVALTVCGRGVAAREVERLRGYAMFSGLPGEVRGLTGAPPWCLRVLEAAATLRGFSVVRVSDGERPSERDARWLKGAPALIEELLLAYEGPHTSDVALALAELYGAELDVPDRGAQ